MASRDSDLVRSEDGQWDRLVGPWSKDKYHFLRRYLQAFTTSMHQKWRIHYLDLFAGPGRCRIRKSDEVVDGSPLIAARARYQFYRLHLCDLDQRCTDSLRARLAAIPQPEEPDIRCGDANKEIHDIVGSITSTGSLSLAFFDPTGLHLQYSSLQVLASRRVDLILFFPDRTDAARNWKRYYEPRKDSHLDKVLGPACDWRRELNRCHPDHRHQRLRELYEAQLEELGYIYRAHERISRPAAKGSHPLYLLIFCSKNPVALGIWQRTSQIAPDGQRQLPFDQ